MRMLRVKCRPAVSGSQMVWFGFGFNAFGQICEAAKCEGKEGTGQDAEVKVIVPVKIGCCDSDRQPKRESEPAAVNTGQTLVLIRASWSRRATLHFGDAGHACLSGFGAPEHTAPHSVSQSRGCLDAQVSERYLTLSFADRVECWALEEVTGAPVWKMDRGPADEAGLPSALPLVPGGYVGTAPPFFRPLSPQLNVTSLALGQQHAVLLSASGGVFTWGSGSHGQLGHGELVGETEPRVLEALWGVAMAGVAAGNWHSVCISSGGDVYTWGWNESGQLGMPARALNEARRLTGQDAATHLQSDGEEDSRGVFISIQAFPALVDIPEDSEVTKVSCGSRHTAAVTKTGDLFTWGWGDYGQLGHGTPHSSDQPMQVDYFSNQGLCVLDVVCGPWNTFVCAVEREPSLS
ncbi:RCC1 domain-containing protein 1-like [Brienomyrus brachyistius]|uniref:RCC1 domain-containing protein 1-like n=1 Tax=Brienomyrus brachyistius TaxID=42636 RepID=UPI0020B3D1AA|nr:RCC1 domain-containing protein 1-like [Brienomyrus brachyistius]